MIKLFIASTLDGFIAREDGSIDWLTGLPNSGQIDHGYNDFLADIDVIIMGRKTYDDVLGFGIPWPYPDHKTYVVTANNDFKTSTPATEVIHEINDETIKKLKLMSRKSIWLVGGGEVIAAFLNENALDEMTISVIPILLGKGIRLFQQLPEETKLELVSSQPFETGVVNLVYRRTES